MTSDETMYDEFSERTEASSRATRRSNEEEEEDDKDSSRTPDWSPLDSCPAG